MQNKHCKKIQDYHIGDREQVQHTITTEDVQQFAQLTGDYNPLHLDQNFAKDTTFKKPVVYGMLSASFISTLIGMKIPGPGALWTSQTLEFLHQVYVGDTIFIEAVVKQLSVAANTMVLKITAKNQNEQDVLKGEATVQLLQVERSQAEANEEKRRKICLVTGGASDIGAAIIRTLVKQGFAVALNYSHSSAKAVYLRDSLQSEGEIYLYQADVTDLSQVETMVQRIEADLGTITAVVHCAAPHNIIQPFDKVEWNQIKQQFSVQIGGLYNCMKKVLPQMVENKIAGRIVCIASIATDDIPPAHQYDYVIAKAALTAFAKSLAVEYSPKGIAVNLVAPGMTETERIADMPQKAKLMTKMQSPSRALIQPTDIAQAVGFLLEQNTCAITGETVRVCGGIRMI